MTLSSALRLGAGCALFLTGFLTGPAAAAAEAEQSSPRFRGGFDLAELREGKGNERLAWEGSMSYGDERARTVLEISGASEVGHRTGEIDGRLFHAHGIGSGLTVLAGVRHDFQPSPHNTYAMLGLVAGLGETGGAESLLFLSDDGKLSGELNFGLQQPLVSRVLADARAEFTWSAQALPLEDVAAGFTEAEFSLRIRYGASATFSPYVGLVHGRLLGKTAELARLGGGPVSVTHFVAGFGLTFGR